MTKKQFSFSSLIKQTLSMAFFLASKHLPLHLLIRQTFFIMIFDQTNTFHYTFWLNNNFSLCVFIKNTFHYALWLNKRISLCFLIKKLFAWCLINKNTHFKVLFDQTNTFRFAFWLNKQFSLCFLIQKTFFHCTFLSNKHFSFWSLIKQALSIALFDQTSTSRCTF